MIINKKSKRQFIRGSLTVEAALVLPIFIYVVIAVAYFLQIIGIQETLQQAITETGMNTAKYAYVYQYLTNYESDVDDNQDWDNKEDDSLIQSIKESSEAILAKSIDSTYYKAKMQDYLDTNKIDHSCIKEGFNGIHTYLSSFMEEDNEIDIIITYYVHLPVLFLNQNDIFCMQRVKLKGWTGHKVLSKTSLEDSADNSKNQDSQEEMVYVTETGSVYHLYEDCSYLKLSIKEAKFGDLANLRNISGSIYEPCALCKAVGNPSEDAVIYITDTGDKYHWDLNCSGLKRTVYEIPLSEVGDRTLCTRCSKRKK